MKTFEKKELVRKFINDQKEIDGSKIDGLIISFQKAFRDLKNTKDCCEKVEDYKVIETMADKCVDDVKKTNPEYQMNALAIVLYFFEMCDFGMSEAAV